jgi:formylglycine-generating enzyme required for sulfatase activity
MHRADRALLLLSTLLVCAACQRTRDSAGAASTSASARGAGSSSIPAPSAQPQPRRGMIWVPPGHLVAGTPPGKWPRLADREIPGEQLVLKGFYIDVFPYPNEEAAIPLTGVPHAAAAKLCGDQGKRLCSELEWERACKGPSNTSYEYGDTYRHDRCGTGVDPVLKPSGLRVACRSEFGVRDLHGGAWEWTSSRWARGTAGELYAVRGGNGFAGELIGRCANAEARAPDTRSASVGFRCCAGPENEAQVVLDVRRGPRLETRGVVPDELERALLGSLPDDAETHLRRFGLPRVEMFYIWRPIANEELYVARVCAGLGKQPACGMLFARMGLGAPERLGFASTGFIPGTLHIERDAGELLSTQPGGFQPRIWVLGGDDPGPFKRKVVYQYGKIHIGEIERHVGKPKGKGRPRSGGNRGRGDGDGG